MALSVNRLRSISFGIPMFLSISRRKFFTIMFSWNKKHCKIHHVPTVKNSCNLLKPSRSAPSLECVRFEATWWLMLHQSSVEKASVSGNIPKNGSDITKRNRFPYHKSYGIELLTEGRTMECVLNAMACREKHFLFWSHSSVSFYGLWQFQHLLLVLQFGTKNITTFIMSEKITLFRSFSHFYLRRISSA